MPISSVITPFEAFLVSPLYGRIPAPGTRNIAGYFPGFFGTQRIPYTRALPMFCRLTWYTLIRSVHFSGMSVILLSIGIFASAALAESQNELKSLGSSTVGSIFKGSKPAVAQYLYSLPSTNAETVQRKNPGVLMPCTSTVR